MGAFRTYLVFFFWRLSSFFLLKEKYYLYEENLFPNQYFFNLWVITSSNLFLIFFPQDWSVYFNEKSAEQTHAIVHIKAFKGY